MVYNGDNSLAYILHPEGTVTRNEGSSGTTYTYNYFKKDQVGSTRVMLSAVGNTLQPQQTTDYYPFGLAHATNNLNKNKYLFSGKELQDGTVNNQMLGLYDFGMRQYDAMIGRWTTIDLYAGKYPTVSPYVYCLNDPINLIDPFGLEPTKDSMSDGNGGWIYYYTLDEVTVPGIPPGKDKSDPGYQPYTPTWPGFIPTGMGDDGGSEYPGPVGGGGSSSSRTSQRTPKAKSNRIKHPVIDNTWRALLHYLSRKGGSVHIGDRTTNLLIYHPDFISRHNRIVAGLESNRGEFHINMTDQVFHIGRTNIDYQFNSNDGSVTYQLFVNDGFWDPDFIDEHFFGDSAPGFRPDRMGPNLERFGGQPYPYIPSTVIIK